MGGNHENNRVASPESVPAHLHRQKEGTNIFMYNAFNGINVIFFLILQFFFRYLLDKPELLELFFE